MAKLNLLFLIEILTISLISSQLCGINPPEGPDYCGNYHLKNNTHKCCYCKHQESDKYYCLLVVKNGTPNGYDCYCENVQENLDLPGAPCLNHSLTLKYGFNITKDYCHQNSLDKRHPCCYYDDGKTKTCFSIGMITSISLFTYNDFLDCFSSSQKINIYLLIIILQNLLNNNPKYNIY